MRAKALHLSLFNIWNEGFSYTPAPDCMAYTFPSSPASFNRQKSFQADGSRQKNAEFQTGGSSRKVIDEGNVFNVPILNLKS